MIKRYNQFIKESKQVPGPGTHGSVAINLSDEEVDMFASEPSLEKLISDNKVALLAPELWYMEDDMETINVLKNYFDINTDSEDFDEEEEPGFDEENESVVNEASYVKNYDNKTKEWVVLYANETKSKEFKKEEDADDFIKDLKKEKEKSGKPESYKDKMKRKVAEAKERHNKKKKVNENIESNDGSIANHEVLICPYCKCEQAEHPENIFQDDFAVYDCDECGKEFDCSRVVEVTYYTKKK